MFCLNSHYRVIRVAMYNFLQGLVLFPSRGLVWRFTSTQYMSMVLYKTTNRTTAAVLYEHVITNKAGVPELIGGERMALTMTS